MQTLFSRHQHQLASLTEQLQYRLSLRERLCSCLSPKAQQALLDAYVKDHSLHLLTTNASWASRLRLSARQLIQACADPDVHQISVHIAAQTAEKSNSKTLFTRTQPDEDTLTNLLSLSQQLDPKDDFRHSLQKLIEVIHPKPRDTLTNQ